jgi:tetratricopeptide (TPR) repeat protein
VVTTPPTVIFLLEGLRRGAGCRGLTSRLMGRYDDALADFTRAIELDPSHGDYAVNEPRSTS